MGIAQQILFISAFAIAVFFFVDRISQIIYNIKLGKDEEIKSPLSFRIKSMLLIALGQKKMFKKPIPALLHLAVYGAFLITQVELLEIFLDGFLGTHRIVWHFFENILPLRILYTLTINLIEFASVSALIATFIFLYRRNALKIPRFVKPEMKGWPTLDANIILLLEIGLVTFIALMNGGDQALQLKGVYEKTDMFVFSAILANALQHLSVETLVILERIGWWGHTLLVFFFLVYITYSKHLHIMLAFPNTFFTRPEPKGEMANMPAIQAEVASMMSGEAAPESDVIPSFGAKDVMDLSWKNLMDAYTCTECGRCTEACPANQTGKKLSPRKIMMDTRDRMEEIGGLKRERGADYTDNKKLIDDYITREELRACTTCNACVEECPVNISPLSIILELRRYMIMEEADSPQEWNAIFSNLENNQAPWQFAPSDRAKWTEQLNN